MPRDTMGVEFQIEKVLDSVSRIVEDHSQGQACLVTVPP